MSRIGKQAIQLREKVKVSIINDEVNVTGPLGSLIHSFPNIVIEQHDNSILIKPAISSYSNAMWGTVRSRINAMVHGVSEGFKEELVLSGVGIKASIQGRLISLSLGKSHGFKIQIQDSIKVEVVNSNTIILQSIDKLLLSRFVAKIVQLFPAEPYKGKGIKKKDQVIYMKEVRKK